MGESGGEGVARGEEIVVRLSREEAQSAMAALDVQARPVYYKAAQKDGPTGTVGQRALRLCDAVSDKLNTALTADPERENQAPQTPESFLDVPSGKTGQQGDGRGEGEAVQHGSEEVTLYRWVGNRPAGPWHVFDGNDRERIAFEENSHYEVTTFVPSSLATSLREERDRLEEVARAFDWKLQSAEQRVREQEARIEEARAQFQSIAFLAGVADAAHPPAARLFEVLTEIKRQALEARAALHDTAGGSDG